ncbi:dolichyl-diphosphooligosaccharide--protein glycosyltransferase subunit Ost4p [[Candida] railenensis]|uniref:Dolichyl-diphosphooligosaccharide--protein glycosyltransferase subunit Ost4p n=1 Tax=[Candida] railenensis TaxID=45579 RepID=A0A9P0VYG7_9ASCO|nr:dolichyl-diphosphooligosaccharide--protein glycosyltransferase subunit Ost4p [[Candida] railenensis]
MITDDQLNLIVITFGMSSMILILIYHAISTNMKNLKTSS